MSGSWPRKINLSENKNIKCFRLSEKNRLAPRVKHLKPYAWLSSNTHRRTGLGMSTRPSFAPNTTQLGAPNDANANANGIFSWCKGWSTLNPARSLDTWDVAAKPQNGRCLAYVIRVWSLIRCWAQHRHKSRETESSTKPPVALVILSARTVIFSRIKATLLSPFLERRRLHMHHFSSAISGSHLTEDLLSQGWRLVRSPINKKLFSSTVAAALRWTLNPRARSPHPHWALGDVPTASVAVREGTRRWTPGG